MKINGYHILIIALLLLSSCEEKGLDHHEFVEYISAQENGLTKQFIGDSLDFQIQYITTDMMCYNALKSNPIQSVTKLKESFSLNHNIVLKIRNKYALSLGEELNFNFKNNLKWICNNDTLKPELYHHENLSSVNNIHNLVLAFDKKGDKHCDFVFEITPNKFIKTKISFRFLNESITNIPNLNLIL